MSARQLTTDPPSPWAGPPRTVEVTGYARGRFEPLAEIFARLVADQGRGGAALAVYQGGEPVVDLVGGTYRADSVQLLFSVTKAVTAVAAAHAHAAGAIDLDAPQSHYWPAFGRPATAGVTVRSVLAHRSGLASFDADLTFEQALDGAADAAIEAQDPYWEPDTRHGYHSFTYGLLVDGVFRRALGQTVGGYVDRHLSQPLGLDVWIGIPPELLDRVHRTDADPQALTPLRRATASASSIPPGLSQRLRRRSDICNDPRLLIAGQQAVSGTGTARSLARLMAATLGPVDGRRVLDGSSRDAMIATRSRGSDVVLGIPTHFGSGMQRPFPQLPMLGPASYGHEGANGCVVVADVERDVAVAFTTSVFPAVSGMSARFASVLAAVRHLHDDDGG
ncbi:MAG TPA: serine hydrolase domain-containing protein [Rugosimonospora sp.]|nr:serine hydrolase domain-containing protein [Rugosimonospora sp.]